MSSPVDMEARPAAAQVARPRRLQYSQILVFGQRRARGASTVHQFEKTTVEFHSTMAFWENAFESPRTCAITTLRPCCASACQGVGPAQRAETRHPQRYGKASPAIPAVGKGTWITKRGPAFIHPLNAGRLLVGVIAWKST